MDLKYHLYVKMCFDPDLSKYQVKLLNTKMQLMIIDLIENYT